MSKECKKKKSAGCDFLISCSLDGWFC